MLILRRIAATVVALGLIASAANAQSKLPDSGKRGQPRTQSNNSQQPPSPDQRGTDASPVIVKVLPSPKSESEITEDAKERKEKADLDRKLVDFNGDLAYYTKILAWVAGLQFVVLLGQVVFLWLAFKESRRSGNIARDAMVAGERAFVFAVWISQFWNKDPETNMYHWRFRPSWQNSGDTPTKNMTMHTECELRDTELPPDFIFDYPTVEIGSALIPPKIVLQGGLAPRAPNPAISPQDILEVQEGRKFIYLWGWAKYWDVFPGTPQHITRFCWSINAAGDANAYVPGQVPPHPGSLSFSYSYHPKGNCADDECPNWNAGLSRELR